MSDNNAGQYDLEWLRAGLQTGYERTAEAGLAAVDTFQSFSTPAKVGIVTAATMATVYATSRRVRRLIRFWTGAGPILVAYRMKEARLKGKVGPEVDRQWEDMHTYYAPKAYNMIEELRGVYVKIGQVIGSRSDTTPKIWRDEFEKLTAAVPQDERRVIEPLLEQEFRCELKEMFDDFQWKALGSASIAQVHSATLKATGTRVAVKVQHPNMESIFQSDLTSFRFFTKLAQPSMLPFHDELARQVMLEFDFVNEATLQMEIKQSMETAFPGKVRVPAIPDKGLVSKRAYVMEYVTGIPFNDWIKDQFESLKAVKGKGMEETIQLMQLQISVRRLFDIILDAFGKQIFEDGLFHADPHPGNIFVADKSAQQIILLDFGQVKRLTQAQRVDLCKFYYVLATHDHTKQEDQERVVDFMQRAGFKSKHGNKEFLYGYSSMMFDARHEYYWDDQGKRHDVDMRTRLEALEEVDELTGLPEHLVMMFRVVAILFGLSTNLRIFIQDFRMSHKWAPYVNKTLAEAGVDVTKL